MSELELGIWRGVQNGDGLIECPITMFSGVGKFNERGEYHSAPVVHATDIVTWPMDAKSGKCTCFNNGIIPEVGDLIWHSRPGPDMAGHLIKQVIRIGKGVEFVGRVIKNSTVRTVEPRILLVDITTCDGRSFDHCWIERPSPHIKVGQWLSGVALIGPHKSEAQQSVVMGLLDPVVIFCNQAEMPEFGSRNVRIIGRTAPEVVVEVI